MAQEAQSAAKRRRGGIILGIATGAAAVLALLAAAGLIVVYTGAFNVAATEDHRSFVRWAFDTTMHNSVERRAANVGAPKTPTPAMVEAGARHYKSACQHCHAGPGVERSEWASGMRPRPPHLAEAARGWEPRELFWIVKHGIAMTGMPAFGPTHDDETIWSIAAFVKELPAMTAERYEAIGNGEDDHRQGNGR